MAKRRIPSPTRKHNLGLLGLLILALLIYRPASLPGITPVAAQSETSPTRYLVIMRDDAALEQAVSLNQAEAVQQTAAADRAAALDQAESLSLTTADLQPDALAAAQRERVINVLHAQSENSQQEALDRIEAMRADGKVSSARSLWVINAISVEAAPGVSQAEIEAELVGLDGVAKVRPDPPLVMTGGPLKAVPVAQAQEMMLPPQNITQIGAPSLWAMGYTGKGIVVANLDSGVSLNNSDLKAKWRGGNNSWLDTHNEHAKPADVMGHGTATMGIMVSSTYGVAPGAKWIAVKMFADNGDAALSDALRGLEWVLDPDGDPATDDGADVVNNSWSENGPDNGCTDDPDLHKALQALIAAGVLPVFSAGNSGPGVATAPLPSNYPEVFAVGAIDSSRQISFFSSRGPTTCRPAGQVFPDVVAPGSWISSSGMDDSYLYINNGTSFSAPHAAGALALLLDAYPSLSAEDQRLGLQRGAVDYWGQTPNNTYGYGSLNVYNSYYQLNIMFGLLEMPYKITFPVIWR